MPSSTRPSRPFPAKKRKTTHPKGLFRTGRSIWNATDDWDELVAASSLSTSSISTRPPRFRGLQSLARTAEGVAVRHFRMLWQDGKVAQYDAREGGMGGARGMDGGGESSDEEESGRRAKRRKASGTGRTGKGGSKANKREQQRSSVDVRMDVNAKGWWELQWPHVPDHLKCRVRDGVMRMHGGWLSMDVIRKLSLFPPELSLPGHLLPALSPKSTSPSGLRTIPLQPHPAYAKQMLNLKIQYCPQYSDAAVADMVRSMPHLQVVNLKGCPLVGTKTVGEICKLTGLRRVNLKGTRVGEGDVGVLMRERGDTLEGFKVDSVVFKDPNTVFTSPYPRLTHLCLPGALINGPRTTSNRAQVYASAISAPAARPTPADATFTWAAIGTFFPSLTHLYLPGLLIPPSDRIVLGREDTLVKLSLGTGGPAVPAGVLVDLLETQKGSLRKLHIGHVEPMGPTSDNLASGEMAFRDCLEQLEGLNDFRWVRDPNMKVSAACEGWMKDAGYVLYRPMQRSWVRNLKHLHLELGHPIVIDCFSPIPTYTLHHRNPNPITSADIRSFANTTSLETLSLPNTPIFNSRYIQLLTSGPGQPPIPDESLRTASTTTILPYAAITLFPRLRTLDLSNTDITTEQVFEVLDECKALSRVDLTSCRGVDVRLRRRVFGAWAESRGLES